MATRYHTREWAANMSRGEITYRVAVMVSFTKTTRRSTCSEACQSHIDEVYIQGLCWPADRSRLDTDGTGREYLRGASALS
ncbi:hypothetical protein POX_b02681 [Penicillium oxalicum]|uniref:hypothetical protein n=1 Tax=Penicillium oxalicum TaxID=69781 RepID=UPI0020B66176|nr:hypothetical protein POX_b02681 [Penicillium oxalicum]KAI2792641.1 hypothetical protein POX_b02681 [Penicillium oxalicum]